MGIIRLFAGGRSDNGSGTAHGIVDASYTVVDTELTGLDEQKDEIVSIGAVHMRSGRIPLAGSFYQVVDPGREIPGESVVLHGITPTEAAGGAMIAEAVDCFAGFADNDILVGHCISVDLAFLNKAYKRSRGRGLENKAVDTYAIHLWLRKHSPSYHRVSPGLDELGLYAIAKKLGVEIMVAHDALSDAFITAQVFQRYIPMLARAGVTDIEGLIKIADPLKGGEVFTSGGEFGSF